MAYIEKRKKGYLVRVVLGYDQNGKRIVKNEMYYPKAKSESAQLKEVKKYADEIERQIKSGEMYNLEEITLNEFYKQWKEDIAPLQLTISKQEYYADIMEKRFLPEIGYLNISKIQPMRLQAIVTNMSKEQGLKPATIRTYFNVISSIMTCAYEMQVIKDNPVHRVKLPKREKDTECHTFTAEQAKAFLQALEDEYTVTIKGHERTLKKTGELYAVQQYTHAITVSTMWKSYFTLALFSGARRGEIAALTWDDVCFDTNTITISKATAITKNGQIIKEPKTKAGIRTLTLPIIVFTKLKEWKEEQATFATQIGDEWENKEGFIFTQANGAQIDLNTPTHKFKDIISMYNNTAPNDKKLPSIKLHDLRHCAASLLIANGADIATVSRMLGHAQISMTLDRYTHALPDSGNAISNKLAELLLTENTAENRYYA